MNEGNYVFLFWDNHREYLPKSLVRDFLRVEDYIVANGLLGWVGYSDTDHLHFTRIWKKVGGKLFWIDDEGRHWFIKKVTRENRYRPRLLKGGIKDGENS